MGQQSWTSDVAEKVKRVKTIKLAMMGTQLIAEAFQQDFVESTVAEQLGINSLLGKLHVSLTAERSILIEWLNHARPRRAQS